MKKSQAVSTRASTGSQAFARSNALVDFDEDELWDCEDGDGGNLDSRKSWLEFAILRSRSFAQSVRNELSRRSSDINEEPLDFEPSVRADKKGKVAQISTAALNAIRAEVEEEVIGEPNKAKSLWVRFQMATGIAQLRIIVNVKRRRVQVERPAFVVAAQLVTSLKFELFVGVLIVANAINIGIDSSYRPGADKPVIIDVAEILFTFIFMVEWALRVLAFSWVWVLGGPMNLFDTFIVWIPGFLFSVILAPAGVELAFAQRINVLRVLRLGRLIRTVRVIPDFRELWTLVGGILGSFNLVLWVFVIMMVVIYMFAVFVVETVGKSETFRGDLSVQDQFGNLASAMFTLFQIMTFDGWHKIVRPITQKMPEALFFFLLFMGLAGIVLTKLLTAIVVTNAMLDAPKRDQELAERKAALEKAKTQKRLTKMFLELDMDGSGMLSQEEFDSVLEDVNFAREMYLMDIDLEEVPDIYEILDDGTGEISTESFISGLVRMKGPAMSRDALKATSRMESSNAHISKLADEVERDLVKPLNKMRDEMDFMHEDLAKIQLLIAKNLDQLDEIGMRRIIRATVPEIDQVMEPTLQEVLRKEELEEIEKQEKGGSSKPSTPKVGDKEETENKGVMMPVMPASFVVQHRETQREERLTDLRNKARRKIVTKKEDYHTPGIHVEFGQTWKEHELDVPDVSTQCQVPLAITWSVPVSKAKAKPKPKAQALIQAAKDGLPPGGFVNLPSSLVQPAISSPAVLQTASGGADGAEAGSSSDLRQAAADSSCQQPGQQPGGAPQGPAPPGAAAGEQSSGSLREGGSAPEDQNTAAAAHHPHKPLPGPPS